MQESAGMEKKTVLVKDAHLHIRVDSDDLNRWKQHVRDYRWQNLTSFVVSTLNGLLRERDAAREKSYKRKKTT